MSENPALACIYNGNWTKKSAIKQFNWSEMKSLITKSVYVIVIQKSTHLAGPKNSNCALNFVLVFLIADWSVSLSS
jgi:hypothetical protein